LLNIFELQIALGSNIQIVYSAKANPFFIKTAKDVADTIEICSAGELALSIKWKVDPQMIIFGGICKDRSDFEDALSYGVRRFSIESVSQLMLLESLAYEYFPIEVLLRISSGTNQFGMDIADLKTCLNSSLKNTKIVGFHYYPGTMRDTEQQINNDFGRFTKKLSEMQDYSYRELEYGGGIGVNYFGESCTGNLINSISEKLATLSQNKNLTIRYEAGRILAYNAGVYVTQVVDVKKIGEKNYVVLNGGHHQFTYHGGIVKQGKRMPSITVMQKIAKTKKQYVTLIGALCTASDVLANDIELPELSIGDYIGFNNAGAYSISEGSALFLSRDLPAIFTYDGNSFNMERPRNRLSWLDTIYGRG
jgi:diaminopimelate decarboxylase